MEKEIWKKVFCSISDEDFVDLIEIWNLKIKGFRKITNENINKTRKMAITEALKFQNLKMIKKFYNKLAEYEEENQVEKKLRDLSLEELVNKYENGKELHFILGGLFASEKEVHHSLAENLIKELFKKYNVESLEKLVLRDDKEFEQANELEVNDLEKKHKKIEIKNQKLQKQINEWEHKYSKLKEEYKIEKQAWIKEKAQLQQELGSEKSKLEGSIIKYDSLSNENIKLNVAIREYKAEIAHLHAQMLNLQNKSIPPANKIAEQKEEVVTQILIIGDPKNKMIDESTNPKFHVINPKEAIDDVNTLVFKEVWILDYLVSPPVKRKIMKKYKEKVKNFKDFNIVKNYLEEGRI